MADIKISQLPTATNFNDDDYTLIVQNNMTKKILKENMYRDYIYSTNEILIGKWINDKPLYRKIINTGSMDFGGAKEIQHNINNIDEIVNVKCTGYGSGTGAYPIPLTFDYNSSINVLSYIVGQSTITFYYSGTYNADWIDNSYMIIEYTKTTD